MKSIFIFATLFLTSSLLVNCQKQNNDQYLELNKFADQIKVINTHEHQHRPEEYGDLTIRFFHLLHSAYLMQDVESAGAVRLDMGPLDSLDEQKQWKMFKENLNYTRATSYYGHFVKGFQKLYDFNDDFFTETNLPVLSAQVKANYSDYDAWFDKAFKKAGFDLMFLDQYWKSFNTTLDERYYALVFHINPLVYQASNKPGSGDEPGSVYKNAEEEGFIIKSLDDYLIYCDHRFKVNIEHKAVCLKNSMAYGRMLYYEDISYEEAHKLYKKPSKHLSADEKKKLQDFLFHWIIKKSIEHDLPIQIHTGFLAGNHGMLYDTYPLHLNNLFEKYDKAKFVLFHGGYPWTGEYAAMAKTFPNVYLDLVWLPQISMQRAIIALDEMLDCVPYNKFFWGGDCAFIEESTGSLEYGKDVVAKVLAARIKRGMLTEEIAKDIITRIFRKNAIEFFQLEKKLGKEFS